MTSSPLNPPSEPAVVEQVITEFFAKSLHIILESRSPYVSSRNYSGDAFTSSPLSSSSSPSSGRPRDKWFNLALRDCPAALENFDLWRQSNLEPLVVDVVLVSRKSKAPAFNEFLQEIKSEKIVERWVIQYENRKSSNIPKDLRSGNKKSRKGGTISHSSEIPSLYKKTYKRTIVLLRSLYTTVRLLPAYKVFRDLNSSSRISPFSLSHKISSFVEPLTRAEDAKMKHFSFAKVDTPCGRFSLTVSYLPVLEDVTFEPPTPISAQFIPDYVGSPLTDPLKRLQSLPSAGSLPTYVTVARRHSWGNDQGVAPSVSPSPSPIYFDSRALYYNPSPRLPPRDRPPDRYPSTCPTSHNVASPANKKNSGLDGYWLSPPLLPSSPAPPTHLTVVQLQSSLLRSESAPVGYPILKLGEISGVLNQGFPPSPCQVSGRAIGAQVTTVSASQTSPKNKLHLKKGSGELYNDITLQKISNSGIDEAENLSARKLPSCFSQRIAYGSSSRFHTRDESDDLEVTCPFAAGNEDLAGQCRVKSSDVGVHAAENLVSGELRLVRSSANAAVGALVQKLKTATPLRQHPPNSLTYLQAVKCEVRSQRTGHIKEKEEGVEKLTISSGSMITASGRLKSRTAAEALEELKSYRVMKEKLLLRQTGFNPLDVAQGEKTAPRG